MPEPHAVTGQRRPASRGRARPALRLAGGGLLIATGAIHHCPLVSVLGSHRTRNGPVARSYAICNYILHKLSHPIPPAARPVVSTAKAPIRRP